VDTHFAVAEIIKGRKGWPVLFWLVVSKERASDVVVEACFRPSGHAEPLGRKPGSITLDDELDRRSVTAVAEGAVSLMRAY
jgi:hypothetical protein